MKRYLIPWTLGVLLVGASSLPVFAQAQDEDPVEAFRRLRRLETPLDFWNAIQFEMDLGKPDIAARFLRGLINKKPSEKDLLTILDKDGITAIMRLGNVTAWSSNAKENAQAIADAKTLIELATEANKKRLANDELIRELITQLNGTPEEKTYAIQELYKIGAPAVPHFLDFLTRAKTSAERDTIKQAMLRMGPATLAPILAALDVQDALLKVDLLDVLRYRHASRSREIVPWLYYLAEAKTEKAPVRKRAQQVLADFLSLPESRLPTAKHALVQEAERYYQHKVTLGDPRSVVIWKYDPKQDFPKALSPETVTRSYAEHYFGHRLASQALSLDPDYKPAQLLALSFAIDKAAEKAGAAPLSRVSPKTAELLAKANPELVIEVLDRALKDNRSGVVLATVRALGDRAEARAKRPLRGEDPALVRALYYPDPRVQLAAAAALLNIPGDPAPRTASRIVDVLARALSPASVYLPGPRILVALTDEGMRNKVLQTVLDAGARPIVVKNGKDALRRLRADAMIEAIVLDSILPFPGLANTLARMRQDVDFGRVPILLAAVPQTRISHDAAYRYRRLQARLSMIREDTKRYLDLLDLLNKAELADKREVERNYAGDRRPSAAEEKMQAYLNVESTYRARREELAKEHPSAVNALKEVPNIEMEMAREANLYDLETQIREEALVRFVKDCRYEQVKVVHTSLLTDTPALDSTILGSIRQAGIALTPNEKLEAAEQAMLLLARLAEGKPEGYDVRPAADAILAALTSGRLGVEGQRAAIRAATTFNGSKPQVALSTVLRDGGRNVDLRLAAGRALIVSIQRQGSLLPRSEVNAMSDLARQEGLDARLRDLLFNVVGTLRSTVRSTGESLRDYRPAPAAPLAPPPAEKKK